MDDPVYRVVEVPGAGRGLVATRDIAKGELVLNAGAAVTALGNPVMGTSVATTSTSVSGAVTSASPDTTAVVATRAQIIHNSFQQLVAIPTAKFFGIHSDSEEASRAGGSLLYRGFQFALFLHF